MRKSSLVAIQVCLLCAFFAFAAARGQDSPPRSWTLRSGGVVYRLALSDGRLTLEYFGPAEDGETPGRDSAAAAPLPPRHDFSGLAEGLSLAPESLHLVTQDARSLPKGVNTIRLTLRHKELPLDIEALYAAWGETGVLSRELKLINRGATPLRVSSLPSLVWDLPSGDYTLRYLWGGWGQERQMAAERLGAGARSFVQSKGRSTNQYVPWLSLRDEERNIEYLAELAWSGNWSMHIERRPGSGRSALRDARVHATMGMRHDFGDALELAPGQTFALPRVAFTAARGDLDDAANRMHRYQREYVVPPAPANRPPLVQFNSWYPLGSNVNSENTKRAADAAAEIGAEVFVLDSGWYTSGDWSKELGDYEVDRRKFPRGLEELAAHVRARKMKFGLWVEIENVGRESRTFRDHPEWCLPNRGAPIVTGDRCQLDFARPDVRDWARRVIERLVRDYRLDWIKIDYNIDIGERFDAPAAGGGGRHHRLSDHLSHYYAWLDELRAAHPALIVENCASGGLRFDTGIMAHAHTTWVSDNVDPIASLQLRYGCTTQFGPEACNHWMVGDKETGEVDLTKPPGWWDFMFRVAMNGQFGVSSRVWDWNQALKERAAANIRQYKQIRGVIAGADVYHLTPPLDLHRPTGWMGLQYVTGNGERSVLLAYRLAQGEAEKQFRLRGLRPDTVYEVRRDGEFMARVGGAELSREGLKISLDEEWRSVVYEITARGVAGK